MKENKSKELIDNALNCLIEAIENGQSDVLKNYLIAMSRFHNYSFHNIMLIVMQKQDASMVAGYKTWKKFNRYVKKGEKGIAVIAPLISKSNNKKEEDSEFEIYGFRVVYVFDVSQTDGEELPIISEVKGNPEDYSLSLDNLIIKSNIALEYSEDILAEGSSYGGRIIIKAGLTPAKEFSVKVHELAHEYLHHKSEEKLTKKQKETEAEAVAYVVCQAIGLDTNSAFQDYIQLYNGDKEILMESFQKIQETSRRILDGLD